MTSEVLAFLLGMVVGGSVGLLCASLAAMAARSGE